MSFKKITLAGGGVLGSQIAYQTAYKGFDVTIWLRSPESVERAKEKIERLHGIYLRSIDAMAASEGVAPRTLEPYPHLHKDWIKNIIYNRALIMYNLSAIER